MNNIRVRLPRKLAKSVSGGVLAEVGRLNPVGAMGITMNMLPLHRVTMTLAEDDLDLAMHDLVEVYNQNGSVGVYRVTKITNTLRKQRKIELNHGLDVFSDAVLATINGWSGPVAQMLQMIVDAQTQKIGGQFYWQLGRCDDTNYWEKDIKYDNAMSCLTEIAKTEEDYMFTFDQSTFPWTLNFVRRDATVLSEFRLRRNTESCVITVDDSDLCTRLYLSVTTEEDDEDGSGTYFEEGYYTFNDTAAQAIYGIVCKTAGIDQSVFSPEVDLEAWKDAYFSRHNTPNVQITIDGMELNRITGETYDEMHLGRMSQVALPDYNATYAERLVSVNYPDALRKPNYVRVSLRNKRETAEDAFQEISDTASTAASTASSGSKSSHNDATYFRRTIGDTANGLYSRIEQTAYYIRAEVVDVANGLYSRIEQTASYIRAEVADTANGLESKIEQTASYIRSEVADTANGLNSKIEQTASYIRSEVSNTANGLNSKIEQTASAIRSEVSDTANGLYSRIEQTASSWAAKVSGVVDSSGNVTAASIALAINKEGSAATIDATRIVLGSKQTAEVVINSLVTRVGTLEADYINTNNLSAKIASLSTVNVIALSASGNITAAGAVIASGVYIGSGGSNTDVGNAIATFGVATESDGSITIPTTKLNGNQGTPINFNIAATQYFIDGVAANRASDVGSVQTTEETAIQLLSEYNTKYKIQTRYKRYNGTWANGSSYVVLTPVDRYQTGYNDGKPTGATLGSKTARTGIYYNVLVTKGDGGQQAFEVDLSDAYTAARSGYTLGTFTLASVTLQGAAYGDITPIGQKVTPTTYNVTLQGSEVTVYERYTTAYKTSTLGYYPRGSKYSGTLYTNGTNKYTGTLYVGGSYTEVTVVGGSPGSGVNLYKNKGSNTYRNSGSAATYYDVGSNEALYKAGTKISGLRQAGTTIANTYYTKS